MNSWNFLNYIFNYFHLLLALYASILIDTFVENYIKQNNEEYFDDHELVVSQNILLAVKMMKKRSNLINNFFLGVSSISYDYKIFF